MSLVTLQRESPETSESIESTELPIDTATETTTATTNEKEEKEEDLIIKSSSATNLIEKYFVLKDAALILPKRLNQTQTSIQSCKSSSCFCCSSTTTTDAGDILTHLQAMVSLLRPQDTINLAIKLTSYLNDHVRYLVIIETTNEENQIEYAVLGIDLKLTTIDEIDSTSIKIACTIGLVLSLYSNFKLSLDFDGGFKLHTFNSNHLCCQKNSWPLNRTQVPFESNLQNVSPPSELAGPG